MTVPARDVMLRIERPIERPEAADEEESPCPPPERELLLSMFRVLKDLHLYCEESGRGELVAEVVDALSMCTADFTALATRLRDRRPDERLPLVPPLARVQTSPLAARALGGGGGGDASVLSSPASLSSSPRSLRERGDEARQLESLDMEQLQEAAKYFSLGQRVTLAPGEDPDGAYLREAEAEGREPAARRFLAKLKQMNLSHGFPTPRVSQTPPTDEGDSKKAGSLRLPVSVGEGRGSAPAAAPRPASSAAAPPAVAAPAAAAPPASPKPPAAAEAAPESAPAAVPAEDDAGWEQPKQKRRSRRRLWPGQQEEGAAPAAAPSAAAAAAAALSVDIDDDATETPPPEEAEAEVEEVTPEEAPPIASRERRVSFGPGDVAEAAPAAAAEALAEAAPEAAEASAPAFVPRWNRPLPAWTSWADECEAEAEAEAAAVAAKPPAWSIPAPAPAAAAPPTRKKKAAPPSSFLATSPPTSPQGVAPAPAPKSGGVCVLDEPGKSWGGNGGLSFASVVKGADAAEGAAADDDGGYSPSSSRGGDSKRDSGGGDIRERMESKVRRPSPLARL